MQDETIETNLIVFIDYVSSVTSNKSAVEDFTKVYEKENNDLLPKN